MELRTCKSCEEHKPVADFYARNGRPYSPCKRCICEGHKRARAAKAKPKINLIGQRFGDLVVLEKVPPRLVDKVGLSRPRGTAWLCACACGQATYLHTAHLTSGNTKSCGCGKYSGSPENIKKAQESTRIANRKHAAAKRVLCAYKGNAKARGLQFNLSYSLFVSLIYSDCHYCGSPPINTVNLKNQGYQYKDDEPEVINYNGIDRIDSTRGYEAGNVVTCCKLCNTGKMNYAGLLDRLRRNLVYAFKEGRSVADECFQAIMQRAHGDADFPQR